jgi:hypothetical protein
VSRGNADAVTSLLAWRGIAHRKLGVVSDEPTIRLQVGGQNLALDTTELRSAWENAIPAAMTE